MNEYRVFLQSEESWLKLNKPNTLTYDVMAFDQIKARIEAMSYNKFEILICPIGGSVQVWAETSYKGSKDSILGSLLSIMATSI